MFFFNLISCIHFNFIEIWIWVTGLSVSCDMTSDNFIFRKVCKCFISQFVSFIVKRALPKLSVRFAMILLKSRPEDAVFGLFFGVEAVCLCSWGFSENAFPCQAVYINSSLSQYFYIASWWRLLERLNKGGCQSKTYTVCVTVYLTGDLILKNIKKNNFTYRKKVKKKETPVLSSGKVRSNYGLYLLIKNDIKIWFITLDRQMNDVLKILCPLFYISVISHVNLFVAHRR